MDESFDTFSPQTVAEARKLESQSERWSPFGLIMTFVCWLNWLLKWRLAEKPFRNFSVLSGNLLIAKMIYRIGKLMNSMTMGTRLMKWTITMFQFCFPTCLWGSLSVTLNSVSSLSQDVSQKNFEYIFMCCSHQLICHVNGDCCKISQKWILSSSFFFFLWSRSWFQTAVSRHLGVNLDWLFFSQKWKWWISWSSTRTCLACTWEQVFWNSQKERSPKIPNIHKIWASCQQEKQKDELKMLKLDEAMVQDLFSICDLSNFQTPKNSSSCIQKSVVIPFFHKILKKMMNNRWIKFGDFHKKNILCELNWLG